MRTRIIVHSQEPVFIRGEGAPSINWSKGAPLEQNGEGEWIWETDEDFAEGEFKLLLYDQKAEIGENHPLYPGASIRVNPKFPI
ncbi:MAG: hypothetical protein S4CHLAM45_03730 [Chlamydiales bacterium]|nr:hypothetical protein [Chlamydiales bacterium]MCH9622489.1 hypothetical protein [Chlamydiales bacterium]